MNSGLATQASSSAPRSVFIITWFLLLANWKLTWRWLDFPHWLNMSLITKKAAKTGRVRLHVTESFSDLTALDLLLLKVKKEMRLISRQSQWALTKVPKRYPLLNSNSTKDGLFIKWERYPSRSTVSYRSIDWSTSTSTSYVSPELEDRCDKLLPFVSRFGNSRLWEFISLEPGKERQEQDLL